MFFAATFTDC